MDNKDLVSETQVVVLMGGLGTRLGLKDCPKVLADVGGIPFFDYQLRLLKRWGFRKFLFLVGFQSGKVEDYYGDGSSQGISIVYSYDGDRQLGTGGALKNAESLIEDDFLLIYGDSFMDIDYQEAVYGYFLSKECGKLGLMTIMENNNQFDKSNVIYDNEKLVLYDKKINDMRMHFIDYGVMMLSQNVLGRIEIDKVTDIADILTGLSKEEKLVGQVVLKRFYEIGNPDSHKEFCKYAHERFDKKRKAAFFDRDGVINELYFNEETEQLDSPFDVSDFQYKENIIDVLLYLQRNGYYIFIVTNQPAAAKGKVSLQKLYELNKWLVKDLHDKGVEVEFINMCPHHPKGDFRTKARFLIRECNCRKPKAGLITDLMAVYNINSEKSFMIGDSYTDILAGKHAGLPTVFLGEMKCDVCHCLHGNKPDWIIKDITELIKIMEENTDAEKLY